MPTARTLEKPAAKKLNLPAPKKAKAPAARMTLAEAMRELEKAGSEQTRKTYLRHGASESLFGVSFARLKTLMKRIGVDHELALSLWDTGNFDACNLAVKIVDPARMTSGDLDRWARTTSTVRFCCIYVGMVAAEGSHPAAKADKWLASSNTMERQVAWALLAQMASRDQTTPDAWFSARLAEIERTIHAAPNPERESMNLALIAIGTRNGALRKAATAAAKRIGKVEVDHGDTACKTPDAASYIEKSWAQSTSKGFESPAAHERTRESPRTRC